MFYISNDIKDLEAYNNLVSVGEKYDGVFTINWANVITHPTIDKYAIKAHSKYETDLEIVEKLSDDWYENNI